MAASASPPVPRRIAQVVRPAAGGIRRHVSDLIAHLDRQQFAPVLYAPPDFTLQPPCSDLVRHSLSIGAKNRPVQDFRTASALAQLLRGNCDLVHAHGLRGAVVGALAARMTRLPFVFTVHNLLPPMHPVHSFLFRQIAPLASRILAVSPAVAHSLTAQGVSSGKIVVVPNGVDLVRFETENDRAATRSALGVQDEALLVLAVGRLSREKGFDVLVKAFAAVRREFPNARLVLVGTGDEEEPLRSLAASLSISVHFTGYVAEAVPLMQAADILVVPSRQEGQGIVALEAMAAGVPVVASRVGGLVDTITEGVTGLLVPPEDSDALAGTLISLWADPLRRAAIARAGRESVERDYRLETQIHKIEAVYHDVLGRTA